MVRIVVTPSRQEEPRVARAHEPHAAVVHVIVKTDDSRNDGLPRQVHDLGTLRNVDAARLADGGDLLAADDDGLIVLRRCAGSVDDARVGQRDDRGIDADVLPHGGRECALLASEWRRDRDDTDGSDDADEAIHVSLQSRGTIGPSAQR